MSVRIPAAAALGLMLAACSSMLPKIEAPQLQVVKVDVLKSDFLQQELRVRMRVDNPNDRVLPVRGITYEMEVAGEPFAHGESDKISTSRHWDPRSLTSA